MERREKSEKEEERSKSEYAADREEEEEDVGDDEEEDEDDDEEEDEDDDDEEEECSAAGGGEEEVAVCAKRSEDDDEDEDGPGASRAKRSEEKQHGVTSCPDRKCVPGIIYLGHIPPRLRPKHLRNMLTSYGEIGRIFLQPEDRFIKQLRRRSGSRRCDFTEGWVEFRDKRVAKRVAASLHNTPMGTRKRQRYASDLWCMKYLHRFQWTHLSERLAYEQSVLQQRLRTEISQAKKETNFYLNSVERSRRHTRQRGRGRGQGQQEEKTWDFTQRRTEEEIQNRKQRKQKNLDKARLLHQKSQSNVSLLAKIFNTNQSD